MYSDVPHSVRALSRSPISLAGRHMAKRGGDVEDTEGERKEGRGEERELKEGRERNAEEK